jgi:hypothetical protein
VEAPDDDPEDLLVRVVTGLLAGVEVPADDPDEVVCEALVRVVTGALDGAELPADDPDVVACEPLARVVTAAVLPAYTPPADPAACERLAPVRTACAELKPGAPGALAPWCGVGESPGR